MRRVDRVELSQQLVKSNTKQSKVSRLEPGSGMKNSQTPLSGTNRENFVGQASLDSRFSVTPSHHPIPKPANELSRVDSGVSYDSSPAAKYKRKVRENSPTFGGGGLM